MQRDAAGFGVVDQIGLREHHHGLGAGVEREHELTLEPPGARRCTESMDEEDHIDVRGEGVRLGRHYLDGIRDGIPVMLEEEARELTQSERESLKD